jgi:hypothetical protein
MRTNFFANASVWMMAAFVLLSGMQAGSSETSAVIQNMAFAEADQVIAVVSEAGGIAVCAVDLETLYVERVWQAPVENAGLTAGSNAECFALS